jgi:DNA-binding NtrC family response regulator
VLLESHDWPGNVRELENLIQRALIDFGTLADVDGIRKLLAVRSQGVQSAPDHPSIGDDLTIEDVERLHIEAVLARCGGNKTNAAAILGIDRKSLYRKVKRLGIETGEGDVES